MFLNEKVTAAEAMLAALVALVPAMFYVARDGQVHGFVTYLLFLNLVAWPPLWRLACEAIRASAILKWSLVSIAVVVAAAAWSDPISVSEFASFAAKATLLAAFLVAAQVVGTRYESFVSIALWLVIATATLTAVVSIYGYYKLDSADYKGGRLLSAGRLHLPVVGALAYGFAAAAIVAFLATLRSWWVVFLVVPFAVLCFAIYLTYSRGALVGLMVVCAVTPPLVLMRNLTQRQLFLFAAFLVVLVVGGLFFLAEWRYRYYYKLIPRGFDVRRLFVWWEFLTAGFANHPVLGVGPLSLPSHPTKLVHAHNIFVSAYYYSGIAGFLATTGLAVLVWKQAFGLEHRAHRIIAVVAFAYALATLTFDGGVLVGRVGYLWLVFWFPVAIVAILRQRELDAVDETENSPSFSERSG